MPMSSRLLCPDC